MREFTGIEQSAWNEERSFCCHELAARLDGQGGLCSLSYIDACEKEGVLYLDEVPLPIISRDNGEFMNRPIYGAAIQLCSAALSGRWILHYPAQHTVSPWSLRGADAEQSYAFAMDSGRLFWTVSCNAADVKEFMWCLQPGTLYSGEKTVHMQQHTGVATTQSGGLYTPQEQKEAMASVTLNGNAKVHWQEEGFDDARQALFIKGTVDYPFGRKTMYLAVGCSVPVVCRSLTSMTALCANWDNCERITVVMALGDSREEALSNMRDGVANHGDILEKKIRSAQQIEHNTLQIESEKLPVAMAFSQMCPQYLDALSVGKTPEGYIGFRAAAYKYGYFSVWDTIYPIRDLLWNGRYGDACRHIRHILTLPMMENTPISGLHAIVQWNEALAFCPNMGLDTLYPSVVKIFRMAQRATEPKYRMLKYAANVGVDRPEEVGFTGDFLAPEVNALWYAACRIVQNEALARNDREVLDDAAQIAASVEEGYEKVFFDNGVGYLHSVGTDFSQPKFLVYQNTNTWGYDYPLGMYLMRNLVKPLAKYQANQLWHPLGHRSVSVDSQIPCEMWKQVHMNQHNSHEMKLQRMAGNMAEVYRVMDQYLLRFDRWKCAEETTNFSRFHIHPAQVCDWQTFTATANLEALRCAVAGVMIHRGGLCYLPAPDSGKVRLAHVPWGKDRICLSIEGEGAYAQLQLDDRSVPGTLQIPAGEVFQIVRVVRTNRLPDSPLLVAALDMPVLDLTAGNKRLEFSCGATAAAPICLLCECCPKVSRNGEEIPVQWDAKSKKVWIDLYWRKGDIVAVQM